MEYINPVVRPSLDRGKSRARLAHFLLAQNFIASCATRLENSASMSIPLSEQRPRSPARLRPRFMSRRLGDVILFGVTAIELALLLALTPTFTLIDWIYVCSNLLVLV